MGRSLAVAHDPSVPSGHLPMLRMGRKRQLIHPRLAQAFLDAALQRGVLEA
jgi:hypothetical protein